MGVLRRGAALRAVVRAIRYAERRKKGMPGGLPADVIYADGAIEGAEEWYFELKKRLIFNGNLTQSRPKSRLKRNELELIIKEAIEGHFRWLAEEEADEGYNLLESPRPAPQKVTINIAPQLPQHLLPPASV